MAEWPASLPKQPIVDAMSFADEPNFVEFKPDVGRGQRHKRYTADRMPIEAAIALTAQQVETMRSFYRNDCASGTMSFTMIDWLNGTARRFTWETPPRFDRSTGDAFRCSVSLVLEA